MDKYIKRDLIKYVTLQNITPASKQNIQDFCAIQPKLSITVYRGHGKSTEIREGNLWYSASANLQVAAMQFATETCCVFIIHLQDIPCIIVNNYVGRDIDDYADEEEIIFLGGGKFYKDPDHNETGFNEVSRVNGKRTFECWYSLSTIEPIETASNIERALDILDGEYDFIDDINDLNGQLKSLNLTHEELEQLFEIIEKEKEKKQNAGFKKRKYKRYKKSKKNIKNKKRKTRKNRRFKHKK